MITKNGLEKRSIKSNFEDILLHMGRPIICPLRSIMAVYSLEWPFASQVNHISYQKYHNILAESIHSKAYALVMVKLLKEWTKMIRHFIDDVNKKYY